MFIIQISTAKVSIFNGVYKKKSIFFAGKPLKCGREIPTGGIFSVEDLVVFHFFIVNLQQDITYTNNQNRRMKTVYDFSVKDRKGKDVSLREYANEVLLIVNTATKCGFTPQYDELEALYKKYRKDGFNILDFPCNQFGQQAPGTDESIHEFCKLNFGTDFPRFKKVKVNGPDADPLFRFLQEQKGFAGWNMEHPIAHILDDMLSKEDPDYAQKPDIKWNFTKFLVNKRGQVVARFEPTEPIENIARQIEELLK